MSRTFRHEPSASPVAVPAPVPVRLGELDFLLDGGAVRRVRWRGTEVVRHVSAPVRATDWSTLAEAPTESRTESGGGTPWRHERIVRVARDGQSADVRLTVEAVVEGMDAAPDAAPGARLTLAVEIRPRTDFDTNRAGLCLLHPLGGVRGETLQVRGSDGAIRRVALPGGDRISPAQPVLDIVAIDQRVGAADVRLAFDGETFEMEDQRNWTDASFKTYCRPLAAPRPYRLAAGEPVRQSITVRVGDAAPGAGAAARAATQSATGSVNASTTDPDSAGADPAGTETDAIGARPCTLPALLLAVEPAWLGMPAVGADGLLVRVGPDLDSDTDSGWTDAKLERLAGVRDGVGGSLDLEIVVPEGAQVREALEWWRERLDGVGLSPDRVIALPEPYLRSHQPEGPWPAGPTPDECVELAGAVFPGAAIGAGALTYFTELNRCPPAPGNGDHVSFGTAAIVHAADTASVFETLEALPDVFASARRLAGVRPLRLGLVAIPMRSNPYGGGLVPPREDRFVTMTDRDARHAGPAGAAFATAAAALAAVAGVEALCLAAPRGPFGTGDGALARAIERLRELAGTEVAVAGSAPGPLEIIAGERRLRVNASPMPIDGLAPFEIRTEGDRT